MRGTSRRRWSVGRVAGTLAAVAGLLVLGVALSAEKPGAFKVIVHATNPQTSLSRAELSSLFLKKTATWSNGRAAVPVDLVEGSPVREAFTGSVHLKPVAAIKAYWRQQIFAGRSVPPLELRSEAEVVAYVKDDAAALGYVGPDYPTRDVKVLAVSD
jgi:ABC-type phosphate transport system substrate-binding protein